MSEVCDRRALMEPLPPINIRDPQHNWGAEAWRAPDLEEGDTLVFDECGRIIRHAGDHYGVDYRSHYFRLVKAKHHHYYLLVKHGGGQERLSLSYAKSSMLEGLGSMTSEARYLLFHTMLHIVHEAEQRAASATQHRYREAFVKGWLKKRKRPGQDSYKVWIEQPLTQDAVKLRLFRAEI